MGCGMSTEEKEGKARNEEIENQLKRDRMQQRNEIKMLLLGTSSHKTQESAKGLQRCPLHNITIAKASSMASPIKANPVAQVPVNLESRPFSSR